MIFFLVPELTFDAVLKLNQDDQQKRICILIEQDNYVYTVIIPRIKKIAYTFDWKEGKPKNQSMNGLGIFCQIPTLGTI